MANTYWIRSHGVRKKPIHSCTLQRMYHSVPDLVKHLLLIVKEHLLIAALQNVAPPPKRIAGKKNRGYKNIRELVSTFCYL